MTVQQIKMPQLGESVTEGTINSWFVSEGEYVKKYDPLCEVMSDKVNAEVPSSYSGVIEKIVAQEGDIVKVSDLICYIKTNEEVESLEKTIHHEMNTNEQVEERFNDNESMKTRYSPAVLKLSSEHNIDLNEIEGTGLKGRITRKDVMKAIERQDAPIVKKQFTEEEGTPFKQSYEKQDSDIELP